MGFCPSRYTGQTKKHFKKKLYPQLVLALARFQEMLPIINNVPIVDHKPETQMGL